MLPIDNRSIKILIVDDTAENLEIAGKILEKEDYDIYIADSGPVALELVKNIPFDVVLLDVMMPVMDGFETCVRLRAMPGREDIPVIFLTAKVEIESMLRAFSCGAVDYIRKPFNDLELIVRVKNHVTLKKIREDLEKKNRKLEEAYSILEEIATTDSLTSLFNRREIVKRIEQEMIRFERSRKQFALVIADIDHFKKVNDRYGHEGGDFVLKKTAEIMAGGIRKQDSTARWGGEEFLMLLPETDSIGAVTLTEKIRKKIEKENFYYQNSNIHITVTFGVAVYTGSETIDELINHADRGLYKGKQSGRNCVIPAG